MEKLKIPYPVIVEGKYDKIKLNSILDADIFTTEGFGIFNNEEARALFSELAKKSKIIILTDSDGGGTQIRKLCLSFLPPDRVINLYVPEIQGKEKRKSAPSKSGTLGVEGIDADILKKIFLPFSVENMPEKTGGITKTDLYVAGLSGGEKSSEKRSEFCKKLGFPSSMSANALLSALNVLYSREFFYKILNENE